ncbi:SulP family inorganic anion transporter [Desulfogranum mediterraneum]|uniref:SulP family inorganic anion transporter n=1 Tax=Desulfogranum mediterraneum TaxID=160661 RepID=UPI000411CC25|nr:sulfate permease [Desulfogranum mediterraneum]
MSRFPLPPAVSFSPALLTTLREGYTRQGLLRDIGSGITVGIVALPLAMAFAIASGTTPDRGIFTAIVAGFLISALGGSRFQIGGPTGAFVVIVSSVIARHGYEGLVVATLLAGFFLILMGIFRFGKLLQFIPYPVTTGFTAGIAVFICSSQLKDFFGLSMDQVPSAFLDRVVACGLALPTFSSPALTTALVTLLAMIMVRKYVPRVPAHIVGIVCGSLLAWILGMEVETVGSRFGGIPADLPHFNPPADFMTIVGDVLPEALTIAVLAGVESLLSAVVADGMTGERHDSSTELIAQGIANIGSVLFGGIPATGAIARTATNIRAGGRTPVAGMVHALTLTLFIVCCAPLASHIPLPSLAAVMVVVAWDMSEFQRFCRLFHAPKSDSLVLVITFLLTVCVDLTVAVQVGVVLAAMLFMRRMSELSSVQLVSPGDEDKSAARPRIGDARVVCYEIDGPFFFGMARRFVEVMHFTRDTPDVLVLRMRRVPSIDATAIESLESVIKNVRDKGMQVLFTGVNASVRASLKKMGTEELIGAENIFDHFEQAMAVLRQHPPENSSSCHEAHTLSKLPAH